MKPEDQINFVVDSAFDFLASVAFVAGNGKEPETMEISRKCDSIVGSISRPKTVDECRVFVLEICSEVEKMLAKAN